MNHACKIFLLLLFIFSQSHLLISSELAREQIAFELEIEKELDQFELESLEDEAIDHIPLVERFNKACRMKNVHVATGILKVDNFLNNDYKINWVNPKESSLLSTRDDRGHTLLFNAVIAEDYPLTKLFIMFGADLYAKNGDGDYTIIYPIVRVSQSIPLIQKYFWLLNKYKFNFDAPCDIHYNRPLHIAKNDVQKTFLLFSEKADIHVENKYGEKPYHEKLSLPEGITLNRNVRIVYREKIEKELKEAKKELKEIEEIEKRVGLFSIKLPSLKSNTTQRS